MANAVNTNNPNGIDDFVEYAVVPHSDAPVHRTADKFAATRWTRLSGKCMYRYDYTAANDRVKPIEVFLGVAVK